MWGICRTGAGKLRTDLSNCPEISKSGLWLGLARTKVVLSRRVSRLAALHWSFQASAAHLHPPNRRYFSKGSPSRSTKASRASKPALSGLVRLIRVWHRLGRPPHPGAIINSGRTMASKSSPLMPRAMASSRRVVPFLCAVLATLAARS